MVELCLVVAVLFVAGNVWFYLRVLRPVHQLALQAQQLTGGNLESFEQDCSGIQEIRELHRAMAGMVGHVRRAQEQSRAYTDRLADGLEIERKRIARELHDDTVQSTIAVTQRIDLAKNWIQSDPERATEMLQLARAQAVDIINALRQLIGGLRPPALEELGLVAALRMHIDSIEQPAVELHVEGIPRRLIETQELTLFRAAQEALSNVSRHSGASRADVHLNYQADGVTLAVQDDGRGFSPPEHLGDLAFRNHYGLLGIEERVSSLGGWLRVDSGISKGMRLQVYLPAETRQPDHLVRDPVCSTLIEPQQAYGTLEYDGVTYAFCCPVCQGAFQKEPELYHTRAEKPAQS